MDPTIPEVYVLWHPACSLGELLAREIYAWLRPGYGLGPQVFYRSLPAPEAPAGGLPPPLPGESRSSALPPAAGGASRGNTQIVVTLIDENMIADAAASLAGGPAEVCGRGARALRAPGGARWHGVQRARVAARAEFPATGGPASARGESARTQGGGGEAGAFAAQATDRSALPPDAGESTASGA